MLAYVYKDKGKFVLEERDKPVIADSKDAIVKIAFFAMERANAKMDGTLSKSISAKMQPENVNTRRCMRAQKRKWNDLQLSTKPRLDEDLTHLPEQRP